MTRGALTLMSTPSVGVPAGSFPYGMDANNKNAYAVLSASPFGIAQFAIDANGQLGQIAGKPAVVAGGSAANARWCKITADGKFLIVGASGNSSVWVFAIDQTDGSLTYLGKPVGTNVSAPSGVAFSPNGNWVLVPMSGSSKLVVFSLDASGNMNAGTAYACGNAPQGIAISAPDANGICGVYVPSTGNKTVVCFSFDQTSGIITPTSTPTIPAPSNFPNAAKITNDGLFLYVACDSANYLTGVYSRDPATNNLTALASPAQTTDNNGGPWGIELSKDATNTSVYVVQSDAQLVSQYDRNTGSGLLAPKTPGSVNTRSPAGARVGSGGPYGFVVTPNNKWAYSTEKGIDSIAQFNVEQDASSTTTITTDFPGIFDVRAAVTKDVGGSFDVLASLAVDFAGSFDVRSGVVTDFPGSFGVLAKVSCDFIGTFDVLAKASRDFIGTFDIRQQVFRDFVGTFDVQGGASSIDVSKISPARVIVFEGSGSRVVVFESSGPRVRFDQMSAIQPTKTGEKWTVARDPDEKSHYAADITDELTDRATTAVSVELVLVGVVQLELPQIQVATLAGVQRTFVVAFLGGTDTDPPEGWKWVARVTCANGERFDKTTWFDKVDP